MKNPFLVADRLYLRPVEPSDAPLLASCLNDPAVRESFFTHTPTSVAAQAERAAGFYAAGSDYIPLVIALKQEDRSIGVTALHRVDLVSRAAVYSICLCDAAEWGKGYAGEVTRAMLGYAFDVLNLHRVQLHVWTENTAAVRAYEAAGFVREGLLREAMRHHGAWADFHVMAILEPEYRAWQQRNGHRAG